MAQDLDFPQTRTTCSLGTLGYRQGPWWRKPIISGLVDGRHKSLAKGREVYTCCLVLEMQTQQQTWPELELLKEQSLNLVQMTNFERVCDVPKVTLKISSKGGSRIKVSLFLGQNSPPISCLSRAGVLGKSACTIKEVTTSNGSKKTQWETRDRNFTFNQRPLHRVWWCETPSVFTLLHICFSMTTSSCRENKGDKTHCFLLSVRLQPVQQTEVKVT